MYHYRSMETFLCLSLSGVRKQLQREGYTFSQMEEVASSGGYCTASIKWTERDRYGELTTLGEILFRIAKDPVGLYLELIYSTRQGETETPRRYRYYLDKRESNLIPGTYLYYFVDPYSETGLCTKLYCLDGIFYPRSYLRHSGILYGQQREGHLQRSVWTYYHKIPERYRKYGKTHYRGKITPGYERYCRRVEEGEQRVLCYTLAKFPEIAESILSVPTPEIRAEWT